MNNDIDATYVDAFEKDRTTTKKLYFSIKRIFDLIVAFIGILIMLPIVLMIKVSYMLTGDFNSIFYTQTRVGKNGKEFKLYKFRTMVMNADEKLEELLKIKEYKEEWDRNQKFDNDPRITKIGKILRKSSLDELPQFINILKGDMALIGPRPLVPDELESHGGIASIYQSVKPGISGWWAVNGRSATDYTSRLSLEYYYCRNCNLWLDIKCIFKTFATVITKRGAK